MSTARKPQAALGSARTDKINEAYRLEREAAKDISPFWLRHRYRQLRRQPVNAVTSTQVAAVRAEMTDRGLELPE